VRLRGAGHRRLWNGYAAANINQQFNTNNYAPKDYAAKNAIFCSSKSANFVKNLATNPEFRQFFAIQK